MNIKLEEIKEIGNKIWGICSNIVDAISNVISRAWESIKQSFKILDICVSRKRFIKLLMSKGIQRNEANKMALDVLKRKGRYTLFDYVKCVA